MKKVFIVFGTRPEAIKMCPLVNILKSDNYFDVIVCVTGQHKEMLQQVLDAFNIIPDYNLNIMKDNQTLFDITTGVMNSIKPILLKENPDLVIVHGDTTTSMSAALSSFYCNIPVAHVEAGLRTYDINNPYPEEFNRRMISLISSYDFAPTSMSLYNLASEKKLTTSNVHVTGNTVLDALRTTIKDDYSSEYIDWAGNNKLVLITAHRRENLGEPMHNMFKGIRKVLLEHPDLRAIYPVHLNPKIQDLAHKYFDDLENILLTSPLGVIDFHNIMSRSYLIITDSGGIQEEATFLKIPTLVMRETTERPEGLSSGGLELIGTSEVSVYNGFTKLLTNEQLYNKMKYDSSCPYGDGHSCDKILEILKESI